MNLNKLKVITFANNNFIKARDLLVSELNNIGVKNIITYNDNDILPNFINENNEIFQFKRGFGYWIWKPYFILKTLQESNDDDIIIYIDSTDLPRIKFIEFIDEHFKKNDILLFRNLREESHDTWTKRDCFILMNCDDEKYHNKVQLEAGVVGFKKTDFNINLIKEWLMFCSNKFIISDIPNIMGLSNHPLFIEHRHDQSILTNLSIKYDLPTCKSSNELVDYNSPSLQNTIY